MNHSGPVKSFSRTPSCIGAFIKILASVWKHQVLPFVVL